MAVPCNVSLPWRVMGVIVCLSLFGNLGGDAFSVHGPLSITTTSRSSRMPTTTPPASRKVLLRSSTVLVSRLFLSKEEEAARLLEKVKQMRSEIAALEGKTYEQVQAQAELDKKATADRLLDMELARQKRKEQGRSNTNNGSFLEIPDTAEDQVRQARNAVERAIRDGIHRQVVRFELLPDNERLMDQDRQWPGGAQQMYREAAGPMSKDLLRQVQTLEGPRLAPNVTAQDIWDFDGSAIVSAMAAQGPAGDVQALVFPNTDSKYLKDIQTIDQIMKDRLFLLINPFWRDIDSWSFNILAPNAKKLAQEVVFDRGFLETYCLIRKTVRGENCVALKAYPYEWQLYAYREQDVWPYEEYPIRLGSSKDEPTAADFGKLLETREEFKMSKNMRQMQR